MILRRISTALLFLTGFFPAILHAEIVDSTTAGFTVREKAIIAATPTSVYNHLVADIGKWWDPKHSWSGDARNISIEGRAGGCFCETLDKGGSVRHMTVVYADPGRMLRMAGALGPMQSFAVTGVMTWTLSATEAGTNVEVEYTLGGYRPGGMASLAGPVDFVVAEQLDRLKKFIEQGSPD